MEGRLEDARGLEGENGYLIKFPFFLIDLRVVSFPFSKDDKSTGKRDRLLCLVIFDWSVILDTFTYLGSIFVSLIWFGSLGTLDLLDIFGIQPMSKITTHRYP